VQTLKNTRDRAGINKETSVRSKILSHLNKGKISYSPMETILTILGELEQS
jgi:GTP-sensing pleiotropic transcriptional regulator CodY